MEIQPAIVVITFNRPKSLNRLLSSLNQAKYIEKEITLIISIDYQDSNAHDEVIEVADNFDWNYGDKKIIQHTKNIGLRQHVLNCGDLVDDYGSIIMLEDDLYVSPYFYNFTKEALTFYKEEDKIGGVSLYTHKKNFLNKFPFELVPDSNDVFFLQIASSWGQAWTKNQWTGFRIWLENKNIAVTDDLPSQVKNWPETSWLKYFIKYLVATNKYFVYPKESFTTNFGDSGTHNLKSNVVYQVPLFFGEKINFIPIEKSVNVYDSFFEILPSKLKILDPSLRGVDFSVDLFGNKEIDKIKTKYLMSSKINKNSKPLKSFGLEVKPMVLNIVLNIEGKMFVLDTKNNFRESSFLDISNEKVFNYLFSSVPIKKMAQLFINLLRNKLKS